MLETNKTATSIRCFHLPTPNAERRAVLDWRAYFVEHVASTTHLVAREQQPAEGPGTPASPRHRQLPESHRSPGARRVGASFGPPPVRLPLALALFVIDKAEVGLHLLRMLNLLVAVSDSDMGAVAKEEVWYSSAATRRRSGCYWGSTRGRSRGP
ncbi:hypothetical protein ABZP36_000573 [Zizania latifolia]